MGDEIDAKLCARHLVHCQRGTVQRHRALWRDESCKMIGGAKNHAQAVAFGMQRDHLGHPVDMARHDMPAKLITQLQRPFQIEPFADVPAVAADAGFRDGLGGNLHLEPVAGAGAEVHHRQADPFAGNRRANVDAGGVIGGGDARPQIAFLVQRQHLAHIGDNAREHESPLAFESGSPAPDPRQAPPRCLRNASNLPDHALMR